ncbi:MAG: hypothetical protein JRC90_11595 [Deltaproteobacteria bacterium]|nr:hypothetical protein [Deltaproteobacteria bacterium]
MGERILSVGGNKASRPITDFGINITDVYYVDSVNGDDGRAGKSVETSLATLDAAIGKCTANQGDVIYLMPNHAEAKDATGSIATADIAGITIVGLGSGDQIPTFSLGHAGATLTVSAADVKISNIQVLSTVADVAVGITITATGDRSIIEQCEFRDSAAAKELLVGVSVAAAAHGVKILKNDFRTTLAAGSNNAILAAAVTDLDVRGNIAYGKFATGVMLTSGVLTRAVITDNSFVNAEAAIGIALNGTSSTGILAKNFLGGTTSIAAALTGENTMWCFENYITGAAAASGLLDPAADSDT